MQHVQCRKARTGWRGKKKNLILLLSKTVGKLGFRLNVLTLPLTDTQLVTRLIHYPGLFAQSALFRWSARGNATQQDCWITFQPNQIITCMEVQASTNSTQASVHVMIRFEVEKMWACATVAFSTCGWNGPGYQCCRTYNLWTKNNFQSSSGLPNNRSYFPKHFFFFFTLFKNELSVLFLFYTNKTVC